MNLNPLDYSQLPSDEPSAIRITKFSDGGVTIVIPKYRPSARARAGGRAIGITIGVIFAILLLIVFPWTFGLPPWKLISLAIGRFPAIAWKLRHPAVAWPALVAFLPLFWILVRVKLVKNFDQPTILGISPHSVYVEKPGLWGRKKYQVPRRLLQNVGTSRTFVANSGYRLFLVFRLSNGADISVFCRWPESVLLPVLKALNDATIATSEKTEPHPQSP
jgi:hypothetical protein